MKLTPELLLTAYAQGIFPMAHEDGQIDWYSPDPRAILPLNRLHASRSLIRTIRSNRYDRRFKSGNPGTVLIHRMLQDVFGAERQQFDFGEGDSRYKHDWRTHALPSFRLCHYAKSSLPAQALRWKSVARY